MGGESDSSESRVKMIGSNDYAHSTLCVGTVAFGLCTPNEALVSVSSFTTWTGLPPKIDPFRLLSDCSSPSRSRLESFSSHLDGEAKVTSSRGR